MQLKNWNNIQKHNETLAPSGSVHPLPSSLLFLQVTTFFSFRCIFQCSFMHIWYTYIQIFPLLLHKESTLFTQKNIYFCFIDYAKAFDCVDHYMLGKY